MGNAIFPTLPGMSWGGVRRPGFRTLVHESVSGNELRATLQQYPLYVFGLPVEFLRSTLSTPEFQTLVGFFLARRGSFDSFLYSDPDDNSCTDMAFGTGDGSTTGFQLIRTYGAGGFTFSEPVQNVNAITNIKVAGSTTTAYTINSTGYVTFTSAPANGAALTWTGSYYYRCRFLADDADFSRVMNGFFDIKKLEFKGAPGNKV